MTVDGMAAARTLQSYSPLAHHGACLYYVWKAYDAHGANTARSARYALDAWHMSEGKHIGDWNPPAGVPVWFGAKPGSDAGDVVISIGGGRVVATDQPRYGVVGTCTIAERAALIDRPYLGWTESIFDQPIAYEHTLEEDMIVNIKGIRGKRRGGLYYVSGGKATFIGGRTWLKQGRYPMFTNETEIARLQSVISGLR